MNNKYSNIQYIDNQLDSYELASQAKLVVSYASIMILELRGYPQLAWYIRENRKRKRYIFKRPCKRPDMDILQQKYYAKTRIYPPAYYLDPCGRNKHFCRYIDDISIHNCNDCEPKNIEVFNRYRLITYEEFKNKAIQLLDK